MMEAGSGEGGRGVRESGGNGEGYRREEKDYFFYDNHLVTNSMERIVKQPYLYPNINFFFNLDHVFFV